MHEAMVVEERLDGFGCLRMGVSFGLTSLSCETNFTRGVPRFPQTLEQIVVIILVLRVPFEILPIMV